jgi:hypothetical protein
MVFRTPDWRCPVDKKIAAERIRARLEKRLANFLGCEVENLPRLRLGELIHASFLFWGDGEEMGGFNPTMHAMTQIVGRDILWESEPKTEANPAPPTSEVIN